MNSRHRNRMAFLHKVLAFALTSGLSDFLTFDGMQDHAPAQFSRHAGGTSQPYRSPAPGGTIYVAAMSPLQVPGCSLRPRAGTSACLRRRAGSVGPAPRQTVVQNMNGEAAPGAPAASASSSPSTTGVAEGSVDRLPGSSNTSSSIWRSQLLHSQLLHDLSCKFTTKIATIKLLRMTNIRRARQHLYLCQICNAKGAIFPLSLSPFLHYKFM